MCRIFEGLAEVQLNLSIIPTLSVRDMKPTPIARPFFLLICLCALSLSFATRVQAQKQALIQAQTQIQTRKSVGSRGPLATLANRHSPLTALTPDNPTLSARADGAMVPSALRYYGQVLDERQRPLPGACVFLPGNHHLMAVTDGRGEFALDVPATAERLVVAYAGLSDRQILLKGESPTAAIVVQLTR